MLFPDSIQLYLQKSKIFPKCRQRASLAGELLPLVVLVEHLQPVRFALSMRLYFQVNKEEESRE